MRLAVRKIVSVTAAGLLALQLALVPAVYQNEAMACGPFFDSTIFSAGQHPDLPLSLYAKGNIGIIEPSYDLPYQIAAYRYLTGKPLTASEQAAYVEYWHHSVQTGDPDTSPATLQWLKDRAKFTGKPDTSNGYFNTYRSVGTEDSFPTYLNCNADAFKTASATLAKLVSKYGADNPICKEWLKGQDAVFCHCQSPQFDYKANKAGVEPGFPEKLPESALLELRQDRQYQMAAAYFYAQKLDDALSLFTAISNDKTSPWQTIAHFMVARTLIRKGTLTKKDGYDTEALVKALTVLKQLAANPNFNSLKSGIEDLTDFVQLRLDPDQCCLALGKELSNPYSGTDLSRKIDDYLFAMNAVVAIANSKKPKQGDQSQPPTAVDPRPATALQTDELTNWLHSFNLQNRENVDGGARGFKSHHSVVWAVAYAVNLKGTEPECAEVESVLAKVGKNDPGFVTASYYRAELLIGGKHFKEAEAVIDAGLATPNLPPSAANDLNRLKLDRAATIEQFFALSFRPPALVVSGYTSNEVPDNFAAVEKKNAFEKNALVLLPESAREINSKFPLANFVQATSSKSVTPSYVKQFAQAAFVRAVMLGDFATALKMTPIMKQGYLSVAKQITDFESAKSKPDQEFAAIFLMLKCPGMRPTVTGGTGRSTAFDKIDDYQDNWWGKDDFESSGDKGGGQEEGNPEVRVQTPFLSAADKATAKSELTKLVAQSEAPNYMGKVAIAYAKAHPADPRVPEALALTVKATHFGSSDESKTTAISTQAFQLLHKSYAGNPWTKKTPYHY
jgi:hypothetical protein